MRKAEGGRVSLTNCPMQCYCNVIRFYFAPYPIMLGLWGCGRPQAQSPNMIGERGPTCRAQSLSVTSAVQPFKVSGLRNEAWVLPGHVRVCSFNPRLQTVVANGHLEQVFN